LNNPEVLKALADLKWTKYLEYQLLLKRLKISGGVKKALEKEISKLKQEMEIPESSPEI
jgi:RNase P/RNase MRP subunit POP5